MQISFGSAFITKSIKYKTNGVENVEKADEALNKTVLVADELIANKFARTCYVFQNPNDFKKQTDIVLLTDADAIPLVILSKIQNIKPEKLNKSIPANLSNAESKRLKTIQEDIDEKGKMYKYSLEEMGYLKAQHSTEKLPTYFDGWI